MYVCMYVCICLGIDQEGDEEKEEDLEDVVMSEENNNDSSSSSNDKKTDDNAELTKLASEEAKELEEAKKERQELMAHEQQAIRSQYNNDKDPETKLQYLLAQSEVFAHFLAGTYNTSFTTTTPISRKIYLFVSCIHSSQCNAMQFIIYFTYTCLLYNYYFCDNRVRGCDQ